MEENSADDRANVIFNVIALTIIVIAGITLIMTAVFHKVPEVEEPSIKVVDLMVGDINPVELFVHDKEDELSSYGVDVNEFRLLDYSYNEDNEVTYVLPADDGYVTLIIKYSKDGVTDYSISSSND